MKKIIRLGITWVLALLMVFAILPQTAHANTLELSFDYNHFVIEKFAGGGDYVIPEYSTHNFVNYPITEIASYAFSGCTDLHSVTFSSTMRFVGDYVFSGCTGLTRVDLGLFTGALDKNVFNGCTSLNEFKVDSNNTSYRSVDGILYSKDYPSIELYPKGRQGKYDIPDDVKSIGDYAFANCPGLTEVTIPNGVGSVDNEAFNGCQNLSSAFFKGFAPSMGNAVFDNCKPGFVIRYYSGMPGFTNPWCGYPTETVAVTVTFNLNGAAGTPPAPQVVNNNACVTRPPDPTRAGYAFGGWYMDTAYKYAWDFSTPALGNMTLYAKWTAVPVKPGADLAGIKLSAGKLSPAFKASTLKYTVNLGENEKSVKVTPAKAYSGATVRIDGKKVASKTVSVANGKSVPMTIKVTYGKKVKTYVLTIKRAKSKNSFLSSLKVSVGKLSPSFSPSATAYTLVLPKGKNKVTISAKAASSLAVVTPTKKTYTIKNGKTLVVKIKVKPQSGPTRTYTITISQAK